jgi:hypothetical protein
MTATRPLVQPNPSGQMFKIVIKNDQKICINERFTGIMIAKGHVSPFAKSSANGGRPGKQKTRKILLL